jgi:hypothetical protein
VITLCYYVYCLLVQPHRIVVLLIPNPFVLLYLIDGWFSRIFLYHGADACVFVIIQRRTHYRLWCPKEDLTVVSGIQRRTSLSVDVYVVVWCQCLCVCMVYKSIKCVSGTSGVKTTVEKESGCDNSAQRRTSVSWHQRWYMSVGPCVWSDHTMYDVVHVHSSYNPLVPTTGVHTL